ncbi:MAG TPA: tetratricopeptide repeat protein [Gemmatimonadales bacterium]
MTSLVRTLISAGVAATAVVHSVAAQGSWTGHQPPCELNTGHFLISGATLYLKQAVETRHPNERDGRLAEAARVLTEAVTTGGQADNPGAWYYFGRYYSIQADPAGADSAFRRVLDAVPACADDVRQYLARLHPISLNEGLRTWGEGHLDSAVSYLHLAGRLNPDDAEVPLYLSVMYSAGGQLDSASKYAELGREAAKTDTAHAARLKQALLELASGYETKAYQEPAIITVPLTRQERDSIAIEMTTDSSRFADMAGQVAAIRARGNKLDDESAARFQAESTTVTNTLARYRSQYDSLVRHAQADSAAVAAAADPAIRHYGIYLEAYPDDVDAAMKVARLYSALGDAASLNAMIERVAASDEIPATQLVQGGLSLHNEGQNAAAIRLLEKALRQVPYERNALYVVARAYYALKDVDHMMPITERLLDVDPLNRSTVRMRALAWSLRAEADSVRHYVALADTGVAWNVTVTQFMVRDSSMALSGGVRNVARRPLPETTLVFEFLDEAGNVAFAESATVPALDPNGHHSLAIRHAEGGVVAWRYRRQE